MLAPLTLDTERFEALFEHARSRIAAVTQRAWTNHNEHDPGITLLQLFSFLLEQRSFWADQVGRDFELALLRLLGHEPLGARSARTVALVEPTFGPVLAVGDALTTRDARRFRVERRLGVLPLGATEGSLTSTASGPRDLLVELRSKRPVLAFDAKGGAAALELSFSTASPVSQTEPLGLLFCLDGPCPSQWSAGAPVAVNPPVALTVRVSNGAGGFGGALTIDDGTCGFRRSGVLRVWPTGWAPSGGVYRLRLEVAECNFPQPVVLTQLGWNAALVNHRQWVSETDAVSWPKLPGRTYDLSPLSTNGAPMGQVHLKLKEPGGWRKWSQVGSLMFSGEGQRHFVLDGARLRFGDGRHGRQPVLAAGTNVRLGFWSGGGSRGNVPARVELVQPSAGPASDPVAFTAVEAVGGRELETLELAETRAAAAQRAVTRAVTQSDVETIAAGAPGAGVGRAIAAFGLREHIPVPVPAAATIFVLPRVARGAPEVPAQLTPFPMPDAGMLDAVRVALGPARLLGSELFVAAPIYQDVCVTLKVSTSRTDGGTLDKQLRSAVEDHLDPVPQPPRVGWPLGGAIDPSAVLAAAQKVLGKLGTVDAVGISLRGSSAIEWCRPVEIGRCHLPRLAGFTLERTARAETGGLK